MLADILGMGWSTVHEEAHRLGHGISEEVAKSLEEKLDNPSTCPHGNPIPRGRCCTNAYNKTGRIVVALSELKSGQGGKVAYILTQERRILQKLIAMGITQRLQIQLIQRYPSYVFQLGQTQIAVDEEIASNIFVLRISPEQSLQT